MTDPWPLLDDAYVAAGHHEPSAEDRVATARRIAAAHRSREPWRTPHPAFRRRSRTRSLLTVIACTGAVCAALVLPTPLQELAGRAGDTSDRWAVSTTGLPPVPSDAAARPLGNPPAPPTGDGGFALLTDARVDPCRPLHWVLRQGAPAGTAAVVGQAMARVSAATGLQFVDDGLTSEPVLPERSPHQLERYGDRWAPLLIAWTDEREHPAMAGAAGLGGSAVVQDGGALLAGGVLLLDRDDLLRADGSLDPSTGTVVLHELGHVLGLGHVDDPAQVMHASGPATDLGPGDLRGLARAGSGPCSTRGPLGG